MNKQNSVFLVAGRTGGPFLPLPAMSHNLKSLKPVYIGIKGGFEEKVCQKNDWKLEFLPEAKLGILSFKKTNWRERLKNFFNLIVLFFVLIYSLSKSLVLLLKYRPKLIISTGSFLAVPLILGSRVSNFLKFTKVKIVVHQQDPLPGLSNRFGAKYADLVSCVFEYTRENFGGFKKATVIPNPVDLQKYQKTRQEFLEIIRQTEPELTDFVSQKSTKPLFFIFGGGGGSRDINDWVESNLGEITKNFRVIHLTGLYGQSIKQINNLDYFQRQILVESMIPVLALADLTLCRAGLGSISELLILKKPAFLVPLPDSHQELNAKLTKDFFFVLKGKEPNTWSKEIQKAYPKWFTKVNYPDLQKNQIQLEKYYQTLNQLVENEA